MRLPRSMTASTTKMSSLKVVRSNERSSEMPATSTAQASSASLNAGRSFGITPQVGGVTVCWNGICGTTLE